MQSSAGGQLFKIVCCSSTYLGYYVSSVAAYPSLAGCCLLGVILGPEDHFLTAFISFIIKGTDMQITTFLYKLAIACWVGGATLFTFVLTPIIFKTQNRDMAGEIVGVLFPGYFKWGLVCGAIALATMAISSTAKHKSIAIVIIVAMLAITSVQAFVIEPKAAALKKEIPSFVTTPKDDPRRVQFKKLHGVSAGSNLTVIVGGIALIALL